MLRMIHCNTYNVLRSAQRSKRARFVNIMIFTALLPLRNQSVFN